MPRKAREREPRPGPRHLRGRDPPADDADGRRRRRVVVLGELAARPAGGRRRRTRRRGHAPEPGVGRLWPRRRGGDQERISRRRRRDTSSPSRTPATRADSTSGSTRRSARSSCGSSDRRRSSDADNQGRVHAARPDGQPAELLRRRLLRGRVATTTNGPGQHGLAEPGALGVRRPVVSNPDRAFTNDNNYATRPRTTSSSSGPRSTSTGLIPASAMIDGLEVRLTRRQHHRRRRHQLPRDGQHLLERRHVPGRRTPRRPALSGAGATTTGSFGFNADIDAAARATAGSTLYFELAALARPADLARRDTHCCLPPSAVQLDQLEVRVQSATATMT